MTDPTPTQTPSVNTDDSSWLAELMQSSKEELTPSEQFRKYMKTFLTGVSSLDAAGHLSNLRAHSRYLSSSTSYGHIAKSQFISNIIGNGYHIQWDNEILQEHWEEFAANPMITGRGNLHAYLYGVASDIFDEGESFTRFRTVPTNKAKLALQWISPQRCDLSYTEPTKRIYQGIQTNADGKIIKYHFWKHNPFSADNFEFANTRTAIKAEDILHSFLQAQSDQKRGIPVIAPSIATLYEILELQSATLSKQKAAQAVGWVVQKRQSGDLPAIGELVKTSKKKDRLPLQKVRIGGVHYLRDDEEIQHVDIKDIGANFTALLQAQLGVVAVQCFTTKEAFTGDLSEVNFSSIRAGLITSRRLLEQMQQLLIILYILKPILNEFKKRLGLTLGVNFSDEAAVITPPKWVWVDQLGDSKADALDLETGLKTIELALRERGLTVKEWLKSKDRSKPVEEAIRETKDIFASFSIAADTMEGEEKDDEKSNKESSTEEEEKAGEVEKEKESEKVETND